MKTINMTYLFIIIFICLLKGISSLDFNAITNGSSFCSSRATCIEGKRTRLDLVMDWKDVNCFCDNLCMEYEDCCPSAKTFDQNLLINKRTNFECVPIHNYLSYYMQGHCAKLWTDTSVKNLCLQSTMDEDQSPSDPFMHTPVTSKFTDITYRNFFCALCNYEKLSDIEPWEARVSCQSADMIEDSYIRANLNLIDKSWGFVEEDGKTVHMCEIYPSARETIVHKLRKCKDYVTTCDNEWLDEETKNLCQSYTTIVYGPIELKTFSNGISQFSPSVYRNYHCAKCNFINESDMACYERDFRQSGYPSPLSFSTLFDFGMVDTICSEGYIWDSFFKKCRAVFCFEENYEYKAGRCVKIYKEVDESTSNDTSVDTRNISIPCDQMFFGSSEYIFIENNTVLIIPYRKTYAVGEYDIFDEGILVCVPDNYSRLMGWLTLFGIGLSCICIVVHLLMFIFVPDLRNLSGKNLASMCISLLIGYICFLITTFRPAGSESCALIGSIMYYGFMSSFTWMNVMSYDVWRTLKMATYQLRLTTGKQWRKFALYSIYAWFIPAILLAIIVYLDLNQPDFIPEYLFPELGERQCWFGQRQGILLYFAGPLTAIMIVNIIFFGLSVQFVSNNTSSSRHMTSTKTEQTQLKLYLRLALLMGLSWITGIIAGYVQSEYIWYVFILLNAFQGVYILFGFTCTKRVSKSLNNMLNKSSVTKKTGKRLFSRKQGVDCSESINSNATNSTLVSAGNISLKT